MLPTEMMLSITVPFTRWSWANATIHTFPRENQHFVAYKQAKRRDDDIAIVNAAFNVTLSGGKIER